jgi:polygalacturonase
MTCNKPLLAAVLFSASAVSAYAQDRRDVAEPAFPPTCVALQAPLRSSERGPIVGQTAAEQDAESASETTIILDALGHCKHGHAVELTLGLNKSDNAFLINPLILPEGVSLIIDGGVTVYASRDPENFQDPSTPTVVCGTIGDYPVQGCKPLITLAAHSGVYGYGILDGQGEKELIGGENAGQATWWNLLTQKKDCKQDGSSSQQSASPDAMSCQEASPVMIATEKSSDGSSRSDLTLYKITIRNPPFHTVELGGKNITIWGVKVQSPWIVPNTDGFDINGTDITIYDTTVANGDQNIAITSGATPTTNVTIDHFRAFSKGGIALLDDGAGVSDVLVQNVDISGDLPSVEGTTVNGISEKRLKRKYHLKSYGQALPNATNNIQGLQINTNLNANSASRAGGKFSSITFKSVCMQDVHTPIHIGQVVPFTTSHPTQFPEISGVTFQDIHVLAPTAQFPELIKGIPTPGVPGGYSVTFEAFPKAKFFDYLTLDNVVFDDDESGHTSISDITAIGNVITTQTNIYPAELNALQSPYVDNPQPVNGVTLSDNSYPSMTTVSSPEQAKKCRPDHWSFTTGELYASVGDATNLAATSVDAGSSVTLSAVVQPVMSQTTQFMPGSYGADPGLLSVGSPALTNPVLFFEGSRAIGFGTLSANGTLASFVIEHVSPGTHTYTALYPADRYYQSLRFGSVTVEAR